MYTALLTKSTNFSTVFLNTHSETFAKEMVQPISGENVYTWLDNKTLL